MTGRLTSDGEEEDEENVAVIGMRVRLSWIRQLQGTIDHQAKRHDNSTNTQRVSATNLINKEHGTDSARNLHSSINARSQQAEILGSSSRDKVGREVISNPRSTAHLLEKGQSPGSPESRPERLLLDEDAGRGDGVFLVPEDVGVDLVELGLDFAGGGCAAELDEGLAGLFGLVVLEKPSRTAKRFSWKI